MFNAESVVIDEIEIPKKYFIFFNVCDGECIVSKNFKGLIGKKLDENGNYWVKLPEKEAQQIRDNFDEMIRKIKLNK